MHTYIVFAHPNRNSFTGQVMDAFVSGLREAGHTAEIGDLYAMGFQSAMDLNQYQREVGGDPQAPVPDDVRREHEKIARADAVAFIYPVWWSDCPAKLKGWFDRVLTYGYAYFRDEEGQHRRLASVGRIVVICSAGYSLAQLEEMGIAQSMRTIMARDRALGLGASTFSMEILGGMADDDGTQRSRNLRRARELGRALGGPEPAGGDAG